MSDLLAPHRQAWYALPLVAVTFTILGFVLVPVLLLIAATGVAFGPWLGPIYALAGTLASASAGFAFGRWAGARRIGKLTGARVQHLMTTLARNGTLSVFLLRKVPAPFTLTNMIIGATTVRYPDFLLGTVLGMGAIIVALAGFGHYVLEVFRHPTPEAVAAAAAFLALPVTLTLVINHALKRRRRAARGQ